MANFDRYLGVGTHPWVIRDRNGCEIAHILVGAHSLNSTLLRT